MIPGEILPKEGTLTLNAQAQATVLMVANTGDRPVQVGSHYHFAETNPALAFDRDAARGMRLDIAAGTAVRFEPGQRREVTLIPIGGARRVFGFNGAVMGPLAVVLALCAALLAGAPAQAQSEEQSEAQCQSPQTQQLMNACAGTAYKRADAELNTAWASAKTFGEAIGQGAPLLDSQRAWLTYRDAACDVQASLYEGGSIQPLIRLTCLTTLTRERTRMLRDFNAY